jgi:DNA-binding XRE family transcriptional regulator
MRAARPARTTRSAGAEHQESFRRFQSCRAHATRPRRPSATTLRWVECGATKPSQQPFPFDGPRRQRSDAGVENDVTWGEWLRRCREQAHLSRDALAGLVGVSERTIRNYEHGLPTRQDTVVDIADALVARGGLAPKQRSAFTTGAPGSRMSEVARPLAGRAQPASSSSTGGRLNRQSPRVAPLGARRAWRRAALIVLTLGGLVLLAGATWQWASAVWRYAGSSSDSAANVARPPTALRPAEQSATEATQRTGAEPEAQFPSLGVGARGTAVRTVQLLLRYRSYDLADDGLFGPITETTVKSFQVKQGLAVTGTVDSDTWERLVVAVGRGSRGDSVRALQLQLVEGHSARLAVDGDFGPETETAVLRFQEQAGLPITGVVDHLTWRHLMQPEEGTQSD